jgi:recombination protein RecA
MNMTEEAKHQTLAQVRRDIEKKYGAGAIISGTELKNRVMPRITTGSLSLDVMLGGGWPVNQFNEVVGEFSSGKTSIVYKTIAANQALDPTFFVVWLASEPFVAEWAEAAGCDLDRFEIIDDNVIESAFTMVLEYVKNRLCDLVVIDSLPAMVPSDENDKGLEDWQVGLAARLNNKFFRKAGASTKRSMTEEDRPCTFLIVNQFREKIGVMHGDPRTTPGGRGKDFAYFTKTEFRRKEWIEYNKERVGIRIAARTTKNKSAPPQRGAEVNFYFADAPGFTAGSYDVADDLVGTAVYTDVVYRVDGGTTYWFDGKKLGVGLAKTLAMVREDIGLQREIRERTLKVTASSYAPDLDVDVAEAITEPVEAAPKKKLSVKRAS